VRTVRNEAPLGTVAQRLEIPRFSVKILRSGHPIEGTVTGLVSAPNVTIATPMLQNSAPYNWEHGLLDTLSGKVFPS